MYITVWVLAVGCCFLWADPVVGQWTNCVGVWAQTRD